MTPQEALERLEAAEKARMQEGGRWEPDWQDAVELLYKATLPLIAGMRALDVLVRLGEIRDDEERFRLELNAKDEGRAALSALVAAVEAGQ